MRDSAKHGDFADSCEETSPTGICEVAGLSIGSLSICSNLSVTRLMRAHHLLVLVGSVAKLVSASRGDGLAIFRDCVTNYVHSACDEGGVRMKDGSTLPLYLRLLGWTCASDADYLCQQEVTSYLVKNDENVEQFHGKWPFVRLLGIQEPASVLFSILNGYMHYDGHRQVRRQVSHRYPLRHYYLLFAYVGMNAWIWSTIFHIRDFPSTEKMDYFSAGAYVLYGLFYSVIKVFHLHERQQEHHHPHLIKGWAIFCLSALLLHIGYLSFITFDYSYNMLANVLVGALHGLVWLLYSVREHGNRPPWSTWPALIVLSLALAMSFELLDFPPWLYTIDAHSLWHLSTIPITWAWYRFLIRDALWEQANVLHLPKRID